jgi:hypothetical protein
MVLNATFNNISVISWRSVLLVEETGVPGEKQLDYLYIDNEYYYLSTNIFNKYYYDK